MCVAVLVEMGTTGVHGMEQVCWAVPVFGQQVCWAVPVFGQQVCWAVPVFGQQVCWAVPVFGQQVFWAVPVFGQQVCWAVPVCGQTACLVNLTTINIGYYAQTVPPNIFKSVIIDTIKLYHFV